MSYPNCFANTTQQAKIESDNMSDDIIVLISLIDWITSIVEIAHSKAVCVFIPWKMIVEATKQIDNTTSAKKCHTGIFEPQKRHFPFSFKKLKIGIISRIKSVFLQEQQTLRVPKTLADLLNNLQPMQDAKLPKIAPMINE